jgi:hypothetical protein
MDGPDDAGGDDWADGLEAGEVLGDGEGERDGPAAREAEGAGAGVDVHPASSAIEMANDTDRREQRVFTGLGRPAVAAL